MNSIDMRLTRNQEGVCTLNDGEYFKNKKKSARKQLSAQGTLGDIAMIMEDSNDTTQDDETGLKKKKKSKHKNTIQLNTGKRFKESNADGGTRGR